MLKLKHEITFTRVLLKVMVAVSLSTCS